MHIVMIDSFQNVMSILMHQFRNLDHAHNMLAFNEWIPFITTADVTFVAYLLHQVTVTCRHDALNFVSALHVANNRKTGFRLTHLVCLPKVSNILSTAPSFPTSTKAVKTTFALFHAMGRLHICWLSVEKVNISGQLPALLPFCTWIYHMLLLS